MYIRRPLNHDLQQVRRYHSYLYINIICIYPCLYVIYVLIILLHYYSRHMGKRIKKTTTTTTTNRRPFPIADLADAIIINQRRYYASHAHEMKTNYLNCCRRVRRRRTDVFFNTAFIIYSLALGSLSYVKLIFPLRRDYRVAMSEKSCYILHR